MDYDERVLPSVGNEVLKSIVAQFDAAELITQREVVSELALEFKGSSTHGCHRYHPVSEQICCNVPENLISSWRMCQSHI